MFFCGVDKLGPKQIIRMLHIDYGGNQLFEEFRPNNLGNAKFLNFFVMVTSLTDYTKHWSTAHINHCLTNISHFLIICVDDICGFLTLRNRLTLYLNKYSCD